MSWRVGVGIALLLAQVGWVVTGQRPRLWAPFHEHAVYSLRVRLADRELGTEESLQRFGLSTWHARGDEAWETNDLDFVKRAASREREGTVELQATVNGERQPPWRFP